MPTKILDWVQIKPWLPKRKRDANKSDYGHVLVIGGDHGMGGAVRMAAEAALRVGAGLVSVATRPEHINIVSGIRPEIMCHQVQKPKDLEPLLARATFIIIGPGLGKSEWAQKLLARVLHTSLPKLLDADALNLLAQNPQQSEDWILTPHPGEAGRLLNETTATVQADRERAIKELQKKYAGVVVLKGAGTLIKAQSDEIAICDAGNPGMASGGMGDVLSGIIGGLAAQGLSLEKAAKAGVFVHAQAADLVAAEGGERGLLATDLLLHLRRLVNPDN